MHFVRCIASFVYYFYIRIDLKMYDMKRVPISHVSSNDYSCVSSRILMEASIFDA
jgi:hypothetical protein